MWDATLNNSLIQINIKLLITSNEGNDCLILFCLTLNSSSYNCLGFNSPLTLMRGWNMKKVPQ